MRTYSREAFEAARNQWRDGDFGPEWNFYRQLAADRGFIFPPSGMPDDSWEDDQPSQRAIVYRAIEDTPRALTEIIRASRSWSDVVRKLMADVDRRREDADLAARERAWDRMQDPWASQAVQRLADIWQRIKDSAA